MLTGHQSHVFWHRRVISFGVTWKGLSTKTINTQFLGWHYLNNWWDRTKIKPKFHWKFWQHSGHVWSCRRWSIINYCFSNINVITKTKCMIEADTCWKSIIYYNNFEIFILLHCNFRCETNKFLRNRAI